jgi:hypothetical protein
MKYPMSVLQSWDNFFYYDQNEFDLNIESELMMLLLQHPRSLFYDNQESAGIAGYENFPNDLTLQIFGRYSIAAAVAWKNRQVTDGSDGTTDRRIAVSQNFINFNANGGNLDVNIVYIPYKSYTSYKTISANIGGYVG